MTEKGNEKSYSTSLINQFSKAIDFVEFIGRKQQAYIQQNCK